MNIKYFLYVLFFNQLHVLLAFFYGCNYSQRLHRQQLVPGHNNVARRCRTALLWHEVGLKCVPRVPKVSPGLFKTASR